jgi:transposase-like protein
MPNQMSVRQHAPQFKLQLCQGLRSGALGIADLKRKFDLPPELVEQWLCQYDSGELRRELDTGAPEGDYAHRIETLQRKVEVMVEEIARLKSEILCCGRGLSGSA